MNVEVKQTKLLSYSTQDSSLKAKNDSAHKMEFIVCPTYDKNHMAWRHVHTLMAQQEQLGKKMQELTDDNNFGIDNEGRPDNVRNFVDIDNDMALLPIKVPTEINIDSSISETNKDTNSDNKSV